MNKMLTPLASFNRATGRIAVGEAELDYENALWLLETFLEEVNSALDTNQESEWALVKTAYLIGAINSLLEQDDNDRHLYPDPTQADHRTPRDHRGA